MYVPHICVFAQIVADAFHEFSGGPAPRFLSVVLDVTTRVQEVILLTDVPVQPFIV